MKNKRLNLDDFKAKADSMETASVLEKVSGGSWSDCHGFWGQLHKKAIAFAKAHVKRKYNL